MYVDILFLLAYERGHYIMPHILRSLDIINNIIAYCSKCNAVTDWLILRMSIYVYYIKGTGAKQGMSQEQKFSESTF